jgi:uncharacterized damage-inducible protein DinB
MDGLRRIFRYNAWANARILDAATQLDAARAAAPVEGIYGSVLDTARHMLGVEHVYLEMMGASPPGFPDAPDASALAITAAAIGAGYTAFLDALSEGELQRRFRVPWFDREFSLRDGLTQVATHSIEHRADLASAISRLGVSTPPLDYVVWVIETEA